MITKYLPMVLTGIAITGVITNIYKLPMCFYLWSVSNLSWATINFLSFKKHKEHNFLWQGILYSVYFFLAVWGILSW